MSTFVPLLDREQAARQPLRARAAVADWRGQYPMGTDDEMVAAVGRQFRPAYGVVLRAVLFAVDGHRAREITAVITGDAVPGRGR